MGTYENPAASTNNARQLSLSKLMEIDGIAKKTAEAMVEIDIRSYADLAQYLSQHTVQEVSAALKKHGVNRPPALIDQETWARQAVQFSQLENSVTSRSDGETNPVEKPEEAPPNHESPEHVAMFRVSFDLMRDEDGGSVLQTAVYDETNGGKEEGFQGSDMSPWVNWILERVNLPSFAVEHSTRQAEVTGEPPANETGAAGPPVPAGLYDAQLEIGDVQLSVSEPTLGFPEKRLKVENNFLLSGADAERLTSQRLPFRFEGYIVDLESGVSELVASGLSQLEPHVFEYRGQQEFAIPDEGCYEFHSIVLLLPPGEMVAYHKGPAIKVVP